MSESPDNARDTGSWRTIRQEVASRAMSKRGRQRQRMVWLKGVVLTGLIGLSAWGLYETFHAWESDRAALATAVHSAPVREIVVLTNGVINREWVARTLALPSRSTLMALDLVALQRRLLASGQISVAILSLNFPDTLIVNLQERTPVARIQVSEALSNRQLLVAKDGVVYEGANYEKSLLASLPWLAGFALRRAADGGYEPIPDMASVSDLLTTAQVQAPHLYRDWLFVSLERLASQQELVVKAQDIPEIVFSTRQDFHRQLAQLDYIIDTTRQQLVEPALQSVNLALGPQVPVKLAVSPDELAKQRPVVPPNFNLQPSSPPRKTKRDL